MSGHHPSVLYITPPNTQCGITRRTYYERQALVIDPRPNLEAQPYRIAKSCAWQLVRGNEADYCKTECGPCISAMDDDQERQIDYMTWCPFCGGKIEREDMTND